LCLFLHKASQTHYVNLEKQFRVWGLNPKPLKKKKVITKTQTSKKLEALFSKKNMPAMALQGLKR
jgi:hypothetical protein